MIPAIKRGENVRLPKVMYRAATLDRATIDVEARTVELSFSSEYPVQRWFGLEILGHEADEVRLDRVQGHGPLLVGHMRNDLVGVIEKAWVASGKGRARVRFGNSARAQEIFQDVQDGIRGPTSAGYKVHQYREEPTGEDETPRFRATDWELWEISLEPIPADPGVGVGRHDDDEARTSEVPIKWSSITTREAEAQPVDGVRGEEREMGEENHKPPVDEAKVREEGRANEKQRATQIAALGDKFGAPELAREAIANDWSVAEFKDRLLELKEKEPERPAPSATQSRSLDLSEKERKRYRITNLIRALYTKDWSGAEYERECSLQIEKQTGVSPRGAYLPDDMLFDLAWLNALPKEKRQAFLERTTLTVAGGGANLKGTDLMASAFVEVLRNKAVTMQAGIRTLDGLRGDVDLPTQSAGGTAYWIATEGNPPGGEANPTFGVIQLQPKELGAYQGMTRKLLLQSTPAIDDLIRDDLTTIMALAIDQGVLIGTGGSGQPTGVAYTGSIGGVEFGDPNGGAPTYPLVVEFETDVATANADAGRLAYITTPKVRGKCKTTSKAGTEAQFLWETDGTMNGYNTFVTNQLRDNLTKGASSGICSEMIFGNWADVILAMWGGLDLKVDEATLVTSGGLVLRVFQSTDVGVRHTGSFSYANDILTA